MNVLIRLATKTTKNLQALVLQALRSALVYVSAMNILSSSPELVSSIFQLTGGSSVEDSNKLNVTKYALELLIVFSSYLENGVRIIHKTAKEIAQRTKLQIFSNFASMLRSGDLDLQANTITLMNVMLAKAPKDSTKKKLFVSWQASGIIDILAELDTEYPATKQQLEIFQV